MIQFQQVDKVFTSGEKQIKALNQIDLQVNKGEIYGVVGLAGG